MRGVLIESNYHITYMHSLHSTPYCKYIKQRACDRWQCDHMCLKCAFYLCLRVFLVENEKDRSINEFNE